MWNEPTPEQLSKMPRLYETEKVPIKHKPIYLHCFIGRCDWFISEYDGDDTFFGYAIMNTNNENGEWGYFSFEELKSLKIRPCFEVDCEFFDPPLKASQIKEIRIP